MRPLPWWSALPITAGLALATPARAQQVIFPWVTVTTTQSAGTITLGGTFQTALASNTARKGCLIQNTSTHVLDVFVGALGSATTGASVQVAASGTFPCNYGPSVITQDVNVTTSTTNDTYVVLSMQ